jgi:hypothetical protein
VKTSVVNEEKEKKGAGDPSKKWQTSKMSPQLAKTEEKAH